VANRRLAHVQNGDYLLAMVDQGRYLWLKFGKVDGMVLLVLLVVSIVLVLQFGIKRARRIDIIGPRPQPSARAPRSRSACRQGGPGRYHIKSIIISQGFALRYFRRFG
jgi:hypothetical protein